MTNEPLDHMRRQNAIGSLWMVAAMAAFAVEDALIKGAASAVPIGQILILFGLGGSLAFGAAALFLREPLFTRDAVSFPMKVRVVFEIMGRLFYVLALAMIPLSTATVILQATPLMVVAGAAVLFRERVGWRRWAAIVIGMCGVILIVQPGAEGFSALSLLAVGGMIGFAGRDLASRAAPAGVSTVLLGFYGFASVVVAGVAYAMWQGEPMVVPERTEGLYLAAAIAAGVTAYACLMKAMRTGEVSAVTPFRYTRLLFGVALGLMFFAEELTQNTMIGSVLIVASGLFILWRNPR